MRQRPHFVFALVLWSVFVVSVPAGLVGCEEEEPERSGRDRRPSTVDQVPSLSSDELAEIEVVTGERLEQFRHAVREFTDAVWAHDFDTAEAQLETLEGFAERHEYVARLVERYATYLADEQRAYDALQQAREAEEFDTVRQAVREAEEAHSHPQLRSISRVLHDEAMLPERRAWIDAERVAQRPWRQYRAADNDLERARALADLLTNAPDSSRASEAQRRFDELYEAGFEGAISLHEAGEGGEAISRARRWRSMLEDYAAVAERAEPFQQLLDRFVAERRDGASGGELAEMGERAEELLDLYAGLLGERAESLEGDALLGRYLRQLSRRVSGTPVPVPPLPMLGHYRVVGDALYAAGDHERLHAILDDYYQRMRPEDRREADRAQALQRHYRERAMYDVRRGKLDPLEAQALWQMDDVFWAGPRGGAKRTIRTESRDGRAIWPDETLGDVELNLTLSWERARQLSLSLRGDRFGRGGLLLELAPRSREHSGSIRLSQADSLRAQLRLYTSERSSEREEAVSIEPLRTDELNVRIVAVAGELEVRVNNTLVYRGDETPAHFAETAGRVGLRLEGRRPRVELSQFSLLVPDGSEVAPLRSAPVEPPSRTSREARLDERLESARRAAQLELERVREEANQQGAHDRALSAANLAAVLRNAQLELDAEQSGTLLARQLDEAGRIADAAAIVRAGAVSDAELAEQITERLAWRGLEELGEPPIRSGVLGELDEEGIRVAGGGLAFSQAGLVAWRSPRLRDLAIRGQVRLQAGERLSLLLRTRRSPEELDSWFRVGLPASEVEARRGTSRVFERVEIHDRRLRGAVQVDEPLPSERAVEIEVRVQRLSLKVYLDGTLVMHLPNERILYESSGFGFAVEASEDGEVEAQLRDVEFQTLHATR